MMQFINRQSDDVVAGFTLVEALVAITLLTVGLIPAFQQANNSLILSTTIQNSAIAANLAQEGIEIVHASRDANWFSLGTTDAQFSNGLLVCAAGCLAQWDDPGGYAGARANPLNVDANGMYTYAAGTPSIFTRLVYITQVTTYELKVVSTVTWTDRGVPRTLSVEDYLFNWN